MHTNQRKFSGEQDLRAMASLASSFPAANLHTVDLPYRFSSWALDDPDNIGLWANAEGQLLGWAVMLTPFWTIDYAYHPDANETLHRQILAWADERARQILHSPSGRPAWFIMTFASQQERIRDLEQAGFACQADVGEDSWSKVFMQLDQATVTNHNLPEGFTLRPLAGIGEVEAYVELHQAVFESKNMTAGWRARTLRHPDYVPELDLVAIAPDGRLAAFCICWLDKKTDRGQVEPLGVHQDFRHLGLGQAILSEGLRRLQLAGASQIYVETDNYRNAALELYESVGFRVIQDVWVFRKDYERG